MGLLPAVGRTQAGEQTLPTTMPPVFFLSLFVVLRFDVSKACSLVVLEQQYHTFQTKCDGKPLTDRPVFARVVSPAVEISGALCVPPLRLLLLPLLLLLLMLMLMLSQGYDGFHDHDSHGELPPPRGLDQAVGYDNFTGRSDRYGATQARRPPGEQIPRLGVLLALSMRRRVAFCGGRPECGRPRCAAAGHVCGAVCRGR